MSHALAAKQAEPVKALFESMPAFPLSHACIVMDLTPIVTIDRRVRLPLSQGRGHGDESFSALWTSRVSKSIFRSRMLWLLPPAPAPFRVGGEGFGLKRNSADAKIG